MARIRIRSVVAGIHRTKVGSHPRIELLVEADNSVAGIDPNSNESSLHLTESPLSLSPS